MSEAAAVSTGNCIRGGNNSGTCHGADTAADDGAAGMFPWYSQTLKYTVTYSVIPPPPRYCLSASYHGQNERERVVIPRGCA